MAQQKSEDRVVPDGGVMPVQPSGGGACGQGKAVPVEQTVVQLALPIATAEAPLGSAREAVRDRSRAGRAGVPKAIVTDVKLAVSCAAARGVRDDRATQRRNVVLVRRQALAQLL